MILGFEPSATTDDRLAKQQSLWTDWVEGNSCLPIKLPGTSKACVQASRPLALFARNDAPWTLQWSRTLHSFDLFGVGTRASSILEDCQHCLACYRA